MTNVELLYAYHYEQQKEKDHEERLARLLGVKWTVKEIREASKKTGTVTKFYKDDDEIFVPLMLGINPNLLEALNKMVGAKDLQDYTPGANEQVVDMSSMTPEQYKAMVLNIFGGRAQ